MWKEASILIALVALSHSASGQIDPRPDRKGNDPVPLTWEEFTSPNPPYPFEEELEACIRRDKMENHGIGEACLGIPREYCSRGPQPPNMEIRDFHIVTECTSYVHGFWKKRLDRDYVQLLRLYAEADKETSYRYARSAKFEGLHALWKTWRDAKCSFESVAVPPYGRIQIASMSCEAGETAVRALEIQALREIWD